MPDEPTSLLGEDEVRKVARLSRLALDETRIPILAEQLSSILTHIEKLQEIDTDEVEPMAHPLPVRNRLDADEPVPGMPVAALLANAPSVEGDYISVPKVLGEGS